MDLTKFNNNAATMSSKEIAALTRKEHKHVLTDVEKLISFYTGTYSAEKAADLVKSGTYKDTQNREYRCFHLSKDAALDLVTGYSIEHRHAVNQRWQELEAMQPKAFPKDYISALEAFLETQKEKERLLAENAKLNTLIDNEFGYCSILRAACFLEIHESAFNWRVLKSHTQLLGLEVKQVPSPRFAYQNLYPLRAFRECYPQFDFDDLTPEHVDNKEQLALKQSKAVIKSLK